MMTPHRLRGQVFGVLGALASGLLFLLTACDDKPTPNPVNTRPAIARVLPSQPSAADTVGGTVNISYVLTDNERVAGFQLIEIVGTTRRVLVNESDLTGRELSRPYAYVVPNQPRLTRITLRAIVIDNVNQRDSVDFTVDVDFARDTTQPFRILSYTGDTIFNRQSVSPSAFNLLLRDQVTSGNLAAMDIRETTGAVGTFLREFSSPNNAQNGNARPFVVLKPSQFNYDALTYTTLEQAYTANPQRATTGTLAVGDIVILKLNFAPHYAAIRISSIRDTGPVDDDDYIIFDYKMSENP